MAEAAQIRVQDAVTQMVNDLDKMTLRRMQGDMHRCAARCCDDRDSHLEVIHRCIENCAIPLNKAQTKVQSEMQQFQNRLQRCVMTCQDRVQDTVRAETTEAEGRKLKRDFEECAVRCVDEHVALLPNIYRKLKSSLDS